MADANRPPPLPVLPSIFTQRRRVIVACTTCRKRKVKCLASENPPRSPCKRCLEKGIACEYGTVGEDKTTRSQQLEQVSESPAYASRWAPQNLPTQLASSHSHARPGSGPFPPAYLESHSHSNPGPSNSQYLYPHYASQSGSNSYRSSPRPAHVQSESNLWETAPMQSPSLPNLGRKSSQPNTANNGRDLGDSSRRRSYLASYVLPQRANCGLCPLGSCTCSWRDY